MKSTILFLALTLVCGSVSASTTNCSVGLEAQTLLTAFRQSAFGQVLPSRAAATTPYTDLTEIARRESSRGELGFLWQLGNDLGQISDYQDQEAFGIAYRQWLAHGPGPLTLINMAMLTIVEKRREGICH